jgi:hypothetical protein
MNWATHHSQSEHYASLAELAVRDDNHQGSLELYRRAAEAEASALSCLSSRKTRTRGITAVRAVALWLNSGNVRQAQRVAKQLLREGSLPPFAVGQLQAMLIGNDVLIAAPFKEPVDGGKLVNGAKIPAWITASPPQLTTLTPNSNCSAIGSGDVNNSTLVQFMSPPNGIQWWTAMTSDALRPVVLSADIGNATVTFKQGLAISYLPASGKLYYVLVNGNIVDSSTVYPFINAVVYVSTQTLNP